MPLNESLDVGDLVYYFRSENAEKELCVIMNIDSPLGWRQFTVMNVVNGREYKQLNTLEIQPVTNVQDLAFTLDEDIKKEFNDIYSVPMSSAVPVSSSAVPVSSPAVPVSSPAVPVLTTVSNKSTVDVSQTSNVPGSGRFAPVNDGQPEKLADSRLSQASKKQNRWASNIFKCK